MSMCGAEGGRGASGILTGLPLDWSVFERDRRLLLDDHTEKRKALWHRYLELTLTSVSPLALDLAAIHPFTMAHICRQFSSPASFPVILPRPAGPAIRYLPPKRRIAPRWPHKPLLPRWSDRLKATGFCSWQGPNRPEFWGFLPGSKTVEAVYRYEGTWLCTHRSEALILLPDQLPASIRAGLIGRPVDELVGMSVLERKGYRIVAARTLPINGSMTMLRVSVGLVPLTVDLRAP